MEEIRSYGMNICVNMVNEFRSFKHIQHNFTPSFIENFIFYLREFKQKNTQFQLIEKKLKAYPQITLDKIILGIHFFLAAISNIEEFFKKKQGNQQIVIKKFEKNQINTTNILNVHTIYEQINYFNYNQYQDQNKQQREHVQFLEDYKFLLAKVPEQLKYQQNFGVDDNLVIDYKLLFLALSSKGKLDPYFLAYLCSQLNQRHQLSLIGIHFVSIDKRCLIYNDTFTDMFMNISKQHQLHKFSKQKYEKYMQFLVNYKDKTKNQIESFQNELENDLCESILDFNEENLNLLEKILIGMLGHPLQNLRELAVLFLNVIYDGVDWELRGSLKPKICCQEEDFHVEYLLEADKKESSIMIMISAKSFNANSKEQIISWHKPNIFEYKSSLQKEGSKFVVASIEFGKFQKCGIYDWKMIKIQKNGKIKALYKVISIDQLKNFSASLSKLENDYQNQKSKPIQGRFIVHPKFSRHLQIHEIFPDIQFQEDDQDEIYGSHMHKKDAFSKVKDEIQNFKNLGINCLYMMGSLERDNIPQEGNSQDLQQVFKKPRASPLAVTCRQTPSSFLGGKEQFGQLVKKANQNQMKIIVDCLTRVSSSRHHKRYNKFLVYKLDEEGKKVVCYGTDGRSINFEDTVLLNYRKKKSWDLLIDEVIEFVNQYGIDGIHLDNGQAWPQIMLLDEEEMYRRDPDGTMAYSEKQIFFGDLVLPDENCGYWATEAQNKYPNPFLIKICKKLWEQFPNFLIISEAREGSFFENREINLIKSGVIPRMYVLPRALSSIFGNKLNYDGTMTPCERKDVNVFRSWYESLHKLLPNGSLTIQSTTSHIWPYPGLLYKRGTWPIVDLFFFLPDIPMTFIGELEGRTYRPKTTNVFMKISLKDNKEDKEDNPYLKKLASIKKSESIGTFQFHKRGGGKKKLEQSIFTNFQFFEQPDAILENQSYDNQLKQNNQKSEFSLIQKLKKSIIKVSSGKSLSELAIGKIDQAERNLEKEIQNQDGFNLKTIGRHYQNRRYLRHSKEVLTKGQFLPLSAEHSLGWHSHVLAFARYTNDQFAIIAINFNDSKVNAQLNLKNLQILLDNVHELDIIVKVEDWLNPQEKDKEQTQQNQTYFTLAELIHDKHNVQLNPYSSLLWGVTIYSEPTQQLQELALKSSIERLKDNISKGTLIKYNQISYMFVRLLQQTNKLQNFVQGFNYLLNKILIPHNISFNKLIYLIHEIRNDSLIQSKLQSFLKSMIEIKYKNNLDLREFKIAEDIVGYNKLGPIAFITHELGFYQRRSGIGYVVNELTQALASLKENVYVVTPYFKKNENEETDYLEKQDIKLNQILTFCVQVGHESYQIEAFQQSIQGVSIFFLKCDQIFTTPFFKNDPKSTLEYICLLAKSSLELFCKIGIIPSLIVTNGWQTGLVPAYTKRNQYGDVYKNTKFFHVIHNLSPENEGKIYPQQEDGVLFYIHNLPSELLVDPYYTAKVLNPSRCAILTCDQWGTVSHYYLEKILRNSPLSSILNKHPKPFSFPNGISKPSLMKKFVKICNYNHYEAKKLIQQKYFKAESLDNEVMLMSYIGRITHSKGVHLIIESLDHLMGKFPGKIQIIVIGKININQKYGQHCSEIIQNLLEKYPQNFYADTNPGIFQDCALLQIGSDFGLIPSLNEPGGIVHQEFFLGSTPIIGYLSGCLADSLKEFDLKTKKGNGFVIKEAKNLEFIFTVERAVNVFKNQDRYQILRRNAYESFIDIADVSRAWDKEFFRLFGKIFIDHDIYQAQRELIDINFDIQKINPALPFKKKPYRVQFDIDQIKKNFEKILNAHKKFNYKKYVFKYSTSRLPKPKNVLLAGSFFENWEKTLALKYDYFQQIWSVTLNLQPGEYSYKYIVDGKWLCNENEPKNNDIYGNINNILII